VLAEASEGVKIVALLALANSVACPLFLFTPPIVKYSNRFPCRCLPAAWLFGSGLMGLIEIAIPKADQISHTMEDIPTLASLIFLVAWVGYPHQLTLTSLLSSC
jgi:hypothetical protein